MNCKLFLMLLFVVTNIKTSLSENKQKREFELKQLDNNLSKFFFIPTWNKIRKLKSQLNSHLYVLTQFISCVKNSTFEKINKINDILDAYLRVCPELKKN